ncbi:hypothetical protein GCM10011516_31130 [Sphingobacterium cellulitidis]|uniref:Uncharacterized protein n=1 Tax=Sphingobacterium cellulitidis TaxID=1768011 RepID=A0A8H9G443_9SPHI|nr:hypothetical protein GCM10011516_31130 [Sphingobacterium soli]
MAPNTITVSPAAGPLTDKGDPEMDATTIPPIIPVNIPANNGAPDAMAIPKHNGNATKKTTILEGKSYFKSLFESFKKADVRVPNINLRFKFFNSTIDNKAQFAY